MNPFQHKSFSRLTFENEQIWSDKGRDKKACVALPLTRLWLDLGTAVCVCVHLLTSSVNVFTHEKKRVRIIIKYMCQIKIEI